MSPKPSYYRTLFISWWLSPIYDLWVWIAVLGNTKGLREKILNFIPRDTTTVVDLATGTGENAFAIKRAFPNIRVMASDFSEKMLGVAIEKNEKNNLGIEFSLKDATRTDYPSGIADFVSITFAIHDIPHEQRLLVMKEAWRILKPGGVFAIYEYHAPKNPLACIPLVTQFLLVENCEAWGILNENIAGELESIGFTNTQKEIYYHGLAQIVAGQKPKAA